MEHSGLLGLDPNPSGPRPGVGSKIWAQQTWAWARHRGGPIQSAAIFFDLAGKRNSALRLGPRWLLHRLLQMRTVGTINSRVVRSTSQGSPNRPVSSWVNAHHSNSKAHSVVPMRSKEKQRGARCRQLVSSLSSLLSSRSRIREQHLGRHR